MQECEARNWPMPRNLHLQFDNCGENKNKEMFCYASLLVESKFVDEVHLNFLVVGHTHCNLDQEFSCVSKRIDNCCYIGSPLAMRELYLTVHDPEWNPDIIGNRKYISVHLKHTHDWRDFFKDIVNTSIKYFQVPHRFMVSRYCDRAIMQYSLFTEPSLSPNAMVWLPKKPVILYFLLI
jgi:hypothetical protein